MIGSDSHEVSRRDFIKGTAAVIGGLIGTLIGIPSIAFLLSPAIKSGAESEAVIALGPLENYPIGVPTRFDFTQTKVNGWERTATSYGLYVVRKNDNEVRVFSDICTHLGCRVTWHPDQQNYISPCHDGHFDILGNVVSGPPPRPLDEFVIKTEGGELFVQLPPFKRERNKKSTFQRCDNSHPREMIHKVMLQKKQLRISQLLLHSTAICKLT